MKKTALLLLVGLMAFIIASCGDNGKNISTGSITDQSSEVTELISSADHESESQIEVVADSSTASTNTDSKKISSVSSKSSAITSSKSGAVASKPLASSTTEAAKNVFQGDGFTMKIPDGWKTMNQSGVSMLVPNNYPEVSDNISIVKTDKDANFSAYTKEMFESTYKTLFEDLNITAFEKTTINGYNAYHVVYSLTASGISMKQEQYLIDGKNGTLTLTFTNVQNDISSIAKDCVKSLTFS